MSDPLLPRSRRPIGPLEGSLTPRLSLSSPWSTSPMIASAHRPCNERPIRDDANVSRVPRQIGTVVPCLTGAKGAPPGTLRESRPPSES